MGGLYPLIRDAKVQEAFFFGGGPLVPWLGFHWFGRRYSFGSGPLVPRSTVWGFHSWYTRFRRWGPLFGVSGKHFSAGDGPLVSPVWGFYYLCRRSSSGDGPVGSPAWGFYYFGRRFLGEESPFGNR